MELCGSTALYTLSDLFVDLRGEQEVAIGVPSVTNLSIAAHTPGTFRLILDESDAPWAFVSASDPACTVEPIATDSVTHQFRVRSESEDPWDGEIQFTNADGVVFTQLLDFQKRRSSLFVLTLSSLGMALSLSILRRKKKQVEGPFSQAQE